MALYGRTTQQYGQSQYKSHMRDIFWLPDTYPVDENRPTTGGQSGPCQLAGVSKRSTVAFFCAIFELTGAIFQMCYFF